MIGFLKANMWTMVVLIVLIVFVALIIRTMIKDRKNGRCTCNCENCTMHCHKQ